MLKNIIIVFSLYSILTSCRNNKEAKILESSKPVSLHKAIFKLSDSALLIKKLDSLTLAKLPLTVNDESYTLKWTELDLSHFKNKVLFNLPSKLHPRTIGGAGIDDSSNADSTFNLNNKHYKAQWLLVARKPHFFVVLVEGQNNYDDNDMHCIKLVSLSYHLKVIDAMNAEAKDPSGNDRFSGELFTTINKDLKLVLTYQYAMATDPENFEWEVEEVKKDIWKIDNTGHFKLIKRSKDEYEE